MATTETTGRGVSSAKMSTVLVAGARTPIGRLLGAFAGMTAADLGAVAIKGAIARSGITADQVDDLVMGQVLQASAGQNPARTAGQTAGLPMSAAAVVMAKAKAEELGLNEFNEAFAAVGLESGRALGLPEDRINVNGGAIAPGHPLGASGARIVLHLALELRRRGGGIGAAALCGGGGQGDALILRVPSR